MSKVTITLERDQKQVVAVSYSTGLSMNILCAGDKLPMQIGFFHK